jgi:outer membrane murein-binding lipoprotein Lpp
MPGKIQELVDQRVKLINDARTFLDEGEADHGGLTEEENARWDNLHAEADALKAQIDKLEAEQQAKADRIAEQEAAEAELDRLRASSDMDRIRNNLGRSQQNGAPQLNRLQAVENTSAELILTVQDDSVFHHDTREFMESIEWPSENCGFVSLYTPKHYGNGSSGLKRVRTRSLWGACALVWKRDVLERVINHRIARNWLGVPPRGRSAKSTMAKRKQIPALIQNSDTAIGRIMNALKLEMWLVDPSPVRHVATTSSINHGGNRGKRNCGSCADPNRRLGNQVVVQPSKSAYSTGT